MPHAKPSGHRSRPPRFLIRHLGNMGDMIFIVPPVLAALKKNYPHCHITFVTSWGYKRTSWLPPFMPRTVWGRRNQGGHSLHLIMTNPHIDLLVHWHDHRLALAGHICHEDARSYPTWSKEYYTREAQSSRYTRVIELDFGIGTSDNPLTTAFKIAGLPADQDQSYHLYFSSPDLAQAEFVMADYPRPRIVLLEGLSQISTRGWDPGKIDQLTQAIQEQYHVDPIWFGANFIPFYQGLPLSLRANIATLRFCDVGIGVLSGPLHFAAAAGLPTLTLYSDHPLRRAAPAYFINPSLLPSAIKHRTIVAPFKLPMTILKGDATSLCLTSAELARQHFVHWTNPGRQATKSGLAQITVDEIMTVLKDMLP